MTHADAAPSAPARYRPEIDGLRAIAVVAVVVSHIWPARLPNGFLGVDVFFVISGYLIGGILHREISEDRFSLARFYERRARRILPALFVALASSLVAAYFWFLPAELRGLGQQTLSTLAAASNFYFWSIQQDYFGLRPDSIPLLHTWSLAVEEQFYLALPLLLLVIHRWARGSVRPIVLACTALSLGLTVFGAERFRAATFYLPHSRAWELLIGVAIAVRAVPAAATRRAADVSTALGLAMIALAIGWRQLADAATAFPVGAAVLACVGTAAVLNVREGAGSTVARALAWRPWAAIGLVSYSFYLWHWPVILFTKSSLLVPFATPGWIVHGGMFAGSLLLAIVSWRFVEQPFRDARRVPLAGLKVLGAGAFALLGVVAMSALGGRPQRFPPRALQLASYLTTPPVILRDPRCFLMPGDTFKDFSRDACLSMAANRRNYLLVGDSHAAHLWYGLARALPDVNILQATATGCPPIVNRYGNERCASLMREVFDGFLTGHRPDAVLLSAHWAQRDIAPLARTVRWLQERGLTPFVFGPINEYDQALPRILALGLRRDGGLSIAGAHTHPGIPAFDRQMSAEMAKTGVTYASTYDALCPHGAACAYITPEGTPVQHDASHLTSGGSVLAISRILDAHPELARAGRPGP